MAADFTMLLRDVVDVTGGDWGVRLPDLRRGLPGSSSTQTLYEVYCYREIGFGTIDIFRQQVCCNAPRHANQLYEYQAAVRPLSAVDMTTGPTPASPAAAAEIDVISKSTSSGESTSAGREHAQPHLQGGRLCDDGHDVGGRTPAEQPKGGLDASHSGYGGVACQVG